MDKIYKILLDILDLKAGFPIANFFIRSDFFHSKTRVGLDPTFFTSIKVANQWEFSKKLIRTKKFASGKPASSAKLTKAKWCIYQLTLIRALLKADFHLYVEYYINEVIHTIRLVNVLIILLLTFWYTTIQYRKGDLRWIFFMSMFFKTNYIRMLLRYVTFHIQVEIGLYVMSPTIESFNRPFMRLWFCAAFTQIEFRSSVRSYASRRHRRKSCVFFTYGFNIKRKNIK